MANIFIHSRQVPDAPTALLVNTRRRARREVPLWGLGSVGPASADCQSAQDLVPCRDVPGPPLVSHVGRNLAPLTLQTCSATLSEVVSTSTQHHLHNSVLPRPSGLTGHTRGTLKCPAPSTLTPPSPHVAGLPTSHDTDLAAPRGGVGRAALMYTVVSHYIVLILDNPVQG